tara:strand:- start:36845 stop:37318 length:474 start_codon:yes stop_codon:yes gene_type:complete
VTILTVVLTGCGSDKVELATVSGTVTMNGEPLPGATVVFRPQTTVEDNEAKVGAESYGKTNGDGQYHLTIVLTGAKGAVVGPNDVMISLDEFEEILPSFDSSGKDRRGPNPIPAEYNSKTTLKFDVPPAGAEDADFKLENPEFKVPDKKAHSEQDVS